MLQRKFNLCLKLEEMWMNATNHRERGNVPALGEKSSWKHRQGARGFSLVPSFQAALGVSTKNLWGAW